MNVRLYYQTKFVAGLYHEGSVHMNTYDVKIGFITTTDNATDQNVAMDRIKYFVHEVLQSGILINAKDHDVAKKLQSAGFRVLILPEEPYDQITGIMLFSKLNAISEGNLCITDIDISSYYGDSIHYLHDEEDSVGPFAENGWWNAADTSWQNNKTSKESDSVVKIDRSMSWLELGLEWEGEEQLDNEDDSLNQVVYISNFKKDDD